MTSEKQELQLAEYRLRNIVQGNRQQMREVLQSAEDAFINNMQANVTHHRYLLDVAIEKRDVKMAAHHQVMADTYQAILNNYTLASNTV